MLLTLTLVERDGLWPVVRFAIMHGQLPKNRSAKPELASRSSAAARLVRPDRVAIHEQVGNDGPRQRPAGAVRPRACIPGHKIHSMKYRS